MTGSVAATVGGSRCEARARPTPAPRPRARGRGGAAAPSQPRAGRPRGAVAGGGRDLQIGDAGAGRRPAGRPAPWLAAVPRGRQDGTWAGCAAAHPRGATRLGRSRGRAARLELKTIHLAVRRVSNCNKYNKEFRTRDNAPLESQIWPDSSPCISVAANQMSSLAALQPHWQKRPREAWHAKVVVNLSASGRLCVPTRRRGDTHQG